MYIVNNNSHMHNRKYMCQCGPLFRLAPPGARRHLQPRRYLGTLTTKLVRYKQKETNQMYKEKNKKEGKIIHRWSYNFGRLLNIHQLELRCNHYNIKRLSGQLSSIIPFCPFPNSFYPMEVCCLIINLLLSQQYYRFTCAIKKHKKSNEKKEQNFLEPRQVVLGTEAICLDYNPYLLGEGVSLMN